MIPTYVHIALLKKKNCFQVFPGTNNWFAFQTLMLFFLLESLNALEDQDLDALMADLVADISEAEQRTIQAQKESSQNQDRSALLEASDGQGTSLRGYGASAAAVAVSQYEEALPAPPAEPMLDLPPPPPPPPPEPLSKVSP